jgi:hypothetical protein
VVTVTGEIARDLMPADTVVEATTGREETRRYALEAGARICGIPAVRAARVDSAELIGFIRDTAASAPMQSYDELAGAITKRFNLDKET